MSDNLANTYTTYVYLVEMQKELVANAWKGEWIALDMTTLLQELYYHVSKLHVELRKGREVERIREFTADIGNIAMFIADTAGALPRVAKCVSCGEKKEIVRACMCEYCLHNEKAEIKVPPLTWIEPHWEGKQSKYYAKDTDNNAN